MAASSSSTDEPLPELIIEVQKRPFKCNQCSFASVQKGDLKAHLRTHNGEKPYKCDQCSYASAQAGQLTRHMRTHTGEKPHKCHLCSFSSIYKMQLAQHHRKHNADFICAHTVNGQRHGFPDNDSQSDPRRDAGPIKRKRSLHDEHRDEKSGEEFYKEAEGLKIAVLITSPEEEVNSVQTLEEKEIEIKRSASENEL
ncbi:c2H2-type zinc-finger domain-containing protein [Ditylenchus destructor]|nr:c2H2-type zinc-finger domain-containing protein [Ditylenchus destructor]